MNGPVERISKDTANAIHQHMISTYGGAAGIHDETLLEAALAQPWQSFDGRDLYPSVEEKAARLSYEIISQHPFIDGNKRTGAALGAALLKANGFKFKPTSEDFLQTMLGVADGTLGYTDLLAFMRNNSQRN